jgi:hypothetical protein
MSCPTKTNDERNNQISKTIKYVEWVEIQIQEYSLLGFL